MSSVYVIVAALQSVTFVVLMEEIKYPQATILDAIS